MIVLLVLIWSFPTICWEKQVQNYYQTRGETLLTVNRGQGRRLHVCLQNDIAETCLHFAPLPSNLGHFQQEVEFPWPLLVPAPLARYNAGEKVTIHAPVLETEHNYTYSALFIAKNPALPEGPLLHASNRDMAGGRLRDVVHIGPVARGTGWLLVVDTNTTQYEGVLMFSPSFVPHSDLVQACVATRPISIYRRDHRSPFPKGFVSMISFPLPWRCREHFDCLVLCPFVTNGNVSLTLTHMGSAESDAVSNIDLRPPATADEFAISGEVRMLGPFFAWGSFYIPEFRALWDEGTYMCRADSFNSTSISLVEIF